MNKLFKQGYFTIIVSIICCFSTMQVSAEPSIEIEELRAILPPSVAKTTAIYGVIKNTGDEPDTLIGFSSNAGIVMLHQTEIISDQAQMKHIDTFVINPGDVLNLKPMSYHLMLMQINHDVVKKNGQISLSLEFKKLGKLLFNIPVLLD